MKVAHQYRPETIEFTAQSKQVPNSLGEFGDAEKARLFMANNLLALHTKLTATRFIDDTEKEDLRNQYVEELEDKLPVYRNAHRDTVIHLEDAKMREKEAKEMVNVSINKIQQLADEVNDGRTDIELDSEFTWEVCYNGKKFYYTFMDNVIKLAKVMEIPGHEIDDLISSSKKNGKFFEGFKISDEDQKAV